MTPGPSSLPDAAGATSTGDPALDVEARRRALLRIEVPPPAARPPSTELRRDRAAPVVAQPVAAEPTVAALAEPVTADPTVAANGLEPPAAHLAADPAEAYHPGRRIPSLGSVVTGGWLLTLFACGVFLVLAGVRIVRTSTEGDVFSPVVDPAAPGYEAVVDPTPTLVLLHSASGVINAITVLSLPSNDAGGGAAVFVPVRTIDELPVFGEHVLSYAYDLGSPEFAREVVGALLGTGIGELELVDAARWADLVAPVAPLTIDNPDPIHGVDANGRSVVRFPAGELTLNAADVGPYLEAIDPDETDLARLYRHEVLWRAWLDAVAEADRLDAVPGETETGIGRFVRALAHGETVLRTLPVEAIDHPVEGAAFEADADATAELITQIVPFPSSPRDGERARLRLLNGTTDTTRATRVAPRLPPVGVELAVIGNAADLSTARTTISYADGRWRDVAEALRDELGTGEVIQEGRPSEAVDITVVLGADLSVAGTR